MNEIKLLDFDTRLFGFKVAMFMGKRLGGESSKRLIKECKDRGIRCCFAELDINDFVTLNMSAKDGFVISDIRMTFEKDLCNYRLRDNKGLKGYVIDKVIMNRDLPYLEALSGELSLTSRFEFDNNFPAGMAGRLYKTWMRNSIDKKTAGGMFIAREIKTRNPAGVITYKRYADYGKIVLFVVGQKHRRKGLGFRLLNRVSLCFKEAGIGKIRVVTESKNIPAQRLYEKNGFLTHSVSAFFHLWIK